MNILKKIFGDWFASSSQASSRDVFFMVIKCGSCAEEVKVRVNKKYDLQSNYLDMGQGGPAWTLRKEVMGNNCCNLMKVLIEFNSGYKIISRDVINGELVEITKS